MLWVFKTRVFWEKHECNTNCWHHTYISCNLSTLLSKQKCFTSQESEAAKYEVWCSYLHISPRMLFQPQLFWVCCFRQNFKKKAEVHCVFQFCVNCASDMQTREVGHFPFALSLVWLLMKKQEFGINRNGIMFTHHSFEITFECLDFSYLQWVFYLSF